MKGFCNSVCSLFLSLLVAVVKDTTLSLQTVSCVPSDPITSPDLLELLLLFSGASQWSYCKKRKENAWGFKEPF